MKRKILAAALCIAALGTVAAAYVLMARPRGMTLTGIVTTDDVVVSSQIQGQLARLLVKEGDTVEADQLLATIQPQERIRPTMRTPSKEWRRRWRKPGRPSGTRRRRRAIRSARRKPRSLLPKRR